MEMDNCTEHCLVHPQTAGLVRGGVGVVGFGRYVHIKCWLLEIAILSLEIDVTRIYCVILWLGDRFLTAKI